MTTEESLITTNNFEELKPPPSNKPKVLIGLIITIVIFVGVFIAVALVRQRQLLEQEAASGSACDQDPNCELLENPGNSGQYTAPKTITHLFITAKDYVRFDPPGKDDGCYNVQINGRNLEWERHGSGPDCKDISNIQVWLGPETSPSQAPTNTATPTSSSSPTPSTTGVPSTTLTPTTTNSPTQTVTPTLTSSPSPTTPIGGISDTSPP